jgi:hypothetical protein
MTRQARGVGPLEAVADAREAAPDRDGARQEWSHPSEGWRNRINWRFVFVSWAIALAVTAVTTFVAVLAAVFVQGGFTKVDAPIAIIVSAFTSFLSFAVVLLYRLPKVDHDRFLHGLAVAAVQTAVTFLFGLISVAVRASVEVSTPFNELGLITMIPAVAAIVGCALAASVMPARGPVPSGTQTAEEPTDRQL